MMSTRNEVGGLILGSHSHTKSYYDCAQCHESPVAVAARLEAAPAACAARVLVLRAHEACAVGGGVEGEEERLRGLVGGVPCVEVLVELPRGRTQPAGVMQPYNVMAMTL